MVRLNFDIVTLHARNQVYRAYENGCAKATSIKEGCKDLTARVEQFASIHVVPCLKAVRTGCVKAGILAKHYGKKGVRKAQRFIANTVQPAFSSVKTKVCTFVSKNYHS